MNIWIVWNGEAAPEDQNIAEVFDSEEAAYEYVTGGEVAAQGYPDAGVDDVVCCAVYETVAESHDDYLEGLRRRMIRDMPAIKREAMRVGWDEELDVETTGARETEGERMKEIWKYQIPIPGAGSFTLEVPEGAQFLTCQIQGKAPVLWALVKITARKREYKFHVFGTGESFVLHDDLTYIGTFQLGGPFVFVGHLFVQGATKL